MDKLNAALDEISEELHHQYSPGVLSGEPELGRQIPQNPDHRPGARLQSLCP
jgi:hypothetical protein